MLRISMENKALICEDDYDLQALALTMKEILKDYKLKEKPEGEEDEVKALISSLSIAKSDWNTSDIANEVLEKLKKVVDG